VPSSRVVQATTSAMLVLADAHCYSERTAQSTHAKNREKWFCTLLCVSVFSVCVCCVCAHFMHCVHSACGGHTCSSSNYTCIVHNMRIQYLKAAVMLSTHAAYTNTDAPCVDIFMYVCAYTYMLIHL
jgi:hypothetical protein